MTNYIPIKIIKVKQAPELQRLAEILGTDKRIVYRPKKDTKQE